LYVGGVLIQTPVTVGQGAASIAQALQAAIAANPDLPVTSAVTGAQITLTALHKGMDAGNSIDLRASYFAGDHLPAGVQLAITALSGGAGNPSIVPAIAVAAGWWNHWIMPYTDGPNVTALLTELDSRFGGLTERDGHAYLATTGSVGTLAAFGAQYNDAQQSVMGIQRPPQPTFAWAASVGAVAAFALNLDPARPLQTLPLPGIMAPALADRFVQTDRNLLLHDGIATFKVDDGGNVLIERLVTSYRANAAGLPDQSYLDIETLATLSYLRFSLRSLIAQKHPRDKLANNGTAFDAGQPIMTPALFIDEAIALALQWQEAGLVQGIDQFKASLIATINASDPSRLDALLQPELIGQFRVFAGKIQFLQ
ncbi:MAG TPA: phage tail sheath subtilisin-like domain-containing protein, partial [Stellaceae bacterium]|nr:phage tail sheath subtilisin-like domain-containing protein [Stellaceae bacterium]